MAIQYDDGTFGPTQPTSDALQQLTDHFAGVKHLPKEPMGVVFGKNAAEVERLKEPAMSAELQARLDALEKQVGLVKRGIVKVPSESDIAKYSTTTGE